MYVYIYMQKIIGGSESWDDPALAQARDKEKGGDDDDVDGRKRSGLKLKVWKKGYSSYHNNNIKKKEEEKDQDEDQKNDDIIETHDDDPIMDHMEDYDNSVAKWMPSKMRMMKKMMANSSYSISVSDHHQKFDEDHHQNQNQNQNQQQQEEPFILMSPSLRIRDHHHHHSTSNTNTSPNNNNNITVRVCADCHTTKTPLWRSGPTGPKVHIYFIIFFF